MTNTFNHASIESGHEHEWFMHTYFDKSRRTACFTFYDFGVGIVGSLWIRGIAAQLKSALGISSQGDLLREAFNRTFPSRTGRQERGLGLLGIKRVFEAGKVSRLVAVANRGYIDFGSGVAKELASEFPGTLLYWEVDATHMTHDSTQEAADG